MFLRAKNALFSVKWRYFWGVKVNISIPDGSGDTKVIVADNPVFLTAETICGEVSNLVRHDDRSIEFTLKAKWPCPPSGDRVVTLRADGAAIDSGDLVTIEFDGDAVVIRGNY